MMTSGKWTAFAQVVVGANHRRKNEEGQDFAFYDAEEDIFALAAVADGHGSASCPHSSEGAEAAVQVIAELLREMRPNIHAQREIRLPRLLEQKWKEKVEALHKSQGREYSGAFPYILYGTTLIAAIATPDFIFVLKIGDGDILLMDGSGEAFPILQSAENVGEETESLCMENSWTFVRSQIIPWNKKQPAMLLLSTDGYANSFADSGGFYKAGTDLFNICREEGFLFVQKNLEDWLLQTSNKGSGDDISLALLVFE